VPAAGAGYGGRETSGALVPATEQRSEPASASVEDDLSLVDTDDDDSTLHRKLLSDGIYTAEELARHYGLSTEEVEALSKPRVPSRQSIEQELAAIKKRMRDDRARYFKDTKAQARYRELLELQAGRKAQPEQEEEIAPDEQDDARQSIEQEIAAIQKSMREDRRAYDRDLKMQARYLELITAREDANELARQTEQIETTAQAILEAVPDVVEFEAGFDAMFDDLPEHAQTAIRYELAQPPDSPARPASDADLKRFATTDEGADLVKAWGREAGRKLATVRARLDRLLRSGGDMEAAVDWFEQLTSEEARGVLNALAGSR
jgi:hypothetical protein